MAMASALLGPWSDSSMFLVENIRPWIPRDLNVLADFLSKNIDFNDPSVTQGFFQQVCKTAGVVLTVERFANDKYKKADTFFSAVYCPVAVGVVRYCDRCLT
jgi:hypothetical protein